MKYLIWKELRENAKWAVLGLLFVYFTVGYTMFSNDFFFEASSTLSFFSFMAASLGFALGLVQIFSESAPDRWAFLMHRPNSAKQIVFSKIIVGISLLITTWVIVILIGAYQLVSMNRIPYQMHWFRLVPAFVAVLVTVPAYFSGLMFIIWKPRWKLTRILFLGSVFILALMHSTLLTTLGWNYLWVVVVFDLLLSLLFFITVLNIFQVSGEQTRTKFLPNIVMLTSVSVGIIVLAVGASLFASLAFSSSARAYRHANLNFSPDGKIYRIQSEYDSTKSSYVITDVVNIADQNDQPFQEKIKQGMSIFEIQTSPKIALRIQGNQNAYYGYRSGVFRYGFYSYLGFKETKGRFSVSHYDGLIYKYITPRHWREYVIGSVIGKNGFRKSTEAFPERFHQIIYTNQSLSKVPSIKKGRVIGQSEEAHEKCLLVCRDTIYKIDPQDSIVEKIYSAPIGKEIQKVGHFPDSKKPIFVIQFADEFKVYSAKTIDAGNEDKKELVIYLPDEEIGSIPRTGVLAAMSLSDANSTHFLSEKNQLLFYKQHMVTQQIVIAGFDGSIVSNDRFNSEELQLGVIADKRPFYTELPLALFPPVSLAIPLGNMLILEEGTEYVFQEIRNKVPLVMAFLAVLIATIALGQWYCKKYRMTSAQKRRCFWATLWLGPSGLLAFWFIEHPVHLEACSQCSHKISVRTETCSKCGAERGQLAENAKSIINEELVVPKADGITSHQTSQAIST